MITDGKDINLRDSLAPVCDVTRHSSFGARRVAAEWSWAWSTDALQDRLLVTRPANQTVAPRPPSN